MLVSGPILHCHKFDNIGYCQICMNQNIIFLVNQSSNKYYIPERFLTQIQVLYNNFLPYELRDNYKIYDKNNES